MNAISYAAKLLPTTPPFPFLLYAPSPHHLLPAFLPRFLSPILIPLSLLPFDPTHLFLHPLLLILLDMNFSRGWSRPFNLESCLLDEGLVVPCGWELGMHPSLVPSENLARLKNETRRQKPRSGYTERGRYGALRGSNSLGFITLYTFESLKQCTCPL